MKITNVTRITSAERSKAAAQNISVTKMRDAARGTRLKARLKAEAKARTAARIDAAHAEALAMEKA